MQICKSTWHYTELGQEQIIYRQYRHAISPQRSLTSCYKSTGLMTFRHTRRHPNKYYSNDGVCNHPKRHGTSRREDRTQARQQPGLNLSNVFQHSAGFRRMLRDAQRRLVACRWRPPPSRPASSSIAGQRATETGTVLRADPASDLTCSSYREIRTESLVQHCG